MGKRQIGELQPGELVITIVLSQIATMPLQDKDFPMLNGVALVFLFVALELLSSYLAMKFRPYRTLMQGHSVLIIKDGQLLQQNLAMIRYSTDDLLEALRLKDVFDINDVKFAVIETNGQLSVMLKDDKQPITPEALDSEKKSKSLQCMVINDGRIISKSFRDCNMDEKKLKNILKNNKVKQEEILFMLADDMGNYSIVRREIET
jgi:uncharacterized membrane protein YcaP (DUF421 family)